MYDETNKPQLPLVALGTWAWGTGISGSKLIFGKNTSENNCIKSIKKQYSRDSPYGTRPLFTEMEAVKHCLES
ncbi:hypothetical protein [Gracilibacillus alcaliphilus]|uniref:hypothetical protein n=1 Tax=Gracilibacillus alcaliphilus TaxID=1401441 RepID=UPI00195BBD7F|nr:hypothetical protein [Gracilibacillus alcaliphilus]